MFHIFIVEDCQTFIVLIEHHEAFCCLEQIKGLDLFTERAFLPRGADILFSSPPSLLV